MGPPLCRQFKPFPFNGRKPVMRSTLAQPEAQLATAKIGSRLALLRAYWIVAVLLQGVRSTPLVAGQEPPGSQDTISQAAAPHPEGVVTPLETLVDEADQNNPRILRSEERRVGKECRS